MGAGEGKKKEILGGPAEGGGGSGGGGVRGRGSGDGVLQEGPAEEIKNKSKIIHKIH